MSNRSNIGQSAIGEMGVGVDTVSPQSAVVGETTITAPPTLVTVAGGNVTGTSTADAELFRFPIRVRLTGEKRGPVQLE